MHKIKLQIAPQVFPNKFRKPTHKYPTNFSTSNYSMPPFKLRSPNTEYQSEARHYGRTFLQTLRKCRKV